MRPHTESMSLAPAPIPAPRGVYSYVDPDDGQLVYFATTMDGAILNAELRRRLPEETEAQIIRDMWRDLDRQDRQDRQDQQPVVSGRPQLGLYVNGTRRR